MPWHVVANHSGCPTSRPFAVVKDSDGSVSGCHPTRDAANSQLAALYASEPAMTGSADCGCGGHNVPSFQAAATEPFDTPYPVPPYPPAEWFLEPPDWLTTDKKMSIDDEGRVAGFFYHQDQCLVHNHGACPRPSPTHYNAFHQSEVITASGVPMTVGVIGNVGGHADDYAPVLDAMAHYSNPDYQLVVCRAYDFPEGGVILGAVLPTCTYGDVALLRRSPLSGDWRPFPDQWFTAHGIQASISDGYDCIGPTLVTRPALPLIRQFAASIREDTVMADARIEVPGGIVITTNTPPGVVPAPTPAAAILAASPPPPGAPPATAPKTAPKSDTTPADDDSDIEARVSALEDAVQQIIQILQDGQDAQMAAIEAAAKPLPAAV